LEEIAQTLTDLGLTAIQTKILLALHRFDYATVKDIAKTAGIHRQEIYPVLSELQKIGLVERRIGIPNQYKTIPLDRMLTVLLARKTNWMSELQKKTTELIQKAHVEMESRACAEQEDYDFTLITGVERFSQALCEWTKNAQTIDEVLIFDRFSYQIAERLITPNFRCKENVKIRIVTSARPEDVHLSGLEKTKLEIRFAPFETPVEIAIYNGNRAHLAIFSSRDNILQTEVAALTSNNPCYVKMLQNYFEVLWRSGRELDITKKRPKQDLSYKPEEKKLEQLKH
jgi:sugar-specific transcriptional regulator TrmB